MHLLVVRHAIAMEREEFAATGNEDDGQRPLTPRGIRRMRRGARGLRRLVPRIDVLASSPLVRAMQTAEILAPVYDGMAIEQVDALKPETPPSSLRRWLRQRADSDVATVVGHEPHLSSAICWFLSGTEEPYLELRKGGAALLELPRTGAAGSARLRWLVTPGQLRAMS